MAKTAGFCFGVARVVDFVEKEAARGNICTLGPVTHNRLVIASLEKQGVRVIDTPEEADENALAVIRAHGVPPDVYAALDARGIRYEDYTCPFVQTIQCLVREDAAAGRDILVLGDKEHPEVIGILGHAGGNAAAIADEEELAGWLPPGRPLTVVVQTTFNTALFAHMEEQIRMMCPEAKIVNTICAATRERQAEADALSQKVDIMLVLGDKRSSNTRKLYETCMKNQPKSYLIESIAEFQLKYVSRNDRIGITAGASTPSAIIKEAYLSMSELEATTTNATESFEEMLNESFVTLHTGDIVKGTVIQVANGEVSVNLGYKSDGLIQRGQFSDDPDVDPAAELNEGDEIEVFVVRVNDGDGNVLLSKKRVDAQKGMTELEEAATSGAIVQGKITEVVKGGVIAIINGIRAFVPSSQVSNRYVEDLSTFKGKEFAFNILEFDKAKKRIVAGRKELANKEAESAKEQVFSAIEAGSRMNGTVSRIADFGAFIDLGGVDGLVHISQLSWGRVKKVSDVLKEGQAVTVTVLDVDKEKGKISLTLKDAESNPWYNVDQKYPIGSIIEGKVVRMVSFGAFVELETGVDGLVHISQIADKHVVKPEDELKIGQIVSVKVTDIDLDNQKISLSKKAVDGVAEESDFDAVPVEYEVVADADDAPVEEAAPVDEE